MTIGDLGTIWVTNYYMYGGITKVLLCVALCLALYCYVLKVRSESKREEYRRYDGDYYHLLDQKKPKDRK